VDTRSRHPPSVQRVVAPIRPRAAPTTAPNGCSRRLEAPPGGTTAQSVRHMPRKGREVAPREPPLLHPEALKEAAADYERREGRESADQALYEWLNGNPEDSIWLSGPRKSGKSTAAARAVIKMVMGERSKSLMWLEYEDFVTACKRCYLDDGAKQWKLIDKAMQCELLVFDDVFPLVRTPPQGRDPRCRAPQRPCCADIVRHAAEKAAKRSPDRLHLGAYGRTGARSPR
jgi:hypothetical protein